MLDSSVRTSLNKSSRIYEVNLNYKISSSFGYLINFKSLFSNYTFNAIRISISIKNFKPFKNRIKRLIIDI